MSIFVRARSLVILSSSVVVDGSRIVFLGSGKQAVVRKVLALIEVFSLNWVCWYFSLLEILVGCCSSRLLESCMGSGPSDDWYPADQRRAPTCLSFVFIRVDLMGSCGLDDLGWLRWLATCPMCPSGPAPSSSWCMWGIAYAGHTRRSGATTLCARWHRNRTGGGHPRLFATVHTCKRPCVRR